MITLKHCLLPVILLLMPVSIILAQATHEELFEKAKYTMETKGDLQSAIQQFEEIIQKFPGENVDAAKSQYYIGLCYEKLGLKEAQKAYQKVLDNYPEQEQEIALARERLNRLLALADGPPKPNFRKIIIPTELSWNVKLSPDGKTLALVYDKKLWMMPLEGNLGPEFSGTPIQLNTEDTEVEGYGLSWSNDGKWIAFNEYPKTRDSLINQGIFIVSSKGGTPKKIFENYRDARVVNYQISLSPDGKNLAFSSVEDNQQYIYTIPVASGNPKQITSMEAREPVFSPDGKTIAFVEDKFAGRGEGDLGLWIIPTNGGISQKIADAGKATSPVWSPDGSMIAFLDETQGKQIFIAQINQTGQAAQKPATIDAPEGTDFSLLTGWTPDNKIGALLAPKQEMSLYTLPARGGQAAMILHDTYALQPRWSKDGNQIYYVIAPEEGENKFLRLNLATVSASGGEGKSLPIVSNEIPVNQWGFQSGNRISPDGKWIISAAWTPEDLSAELMAVTSKIWKITTDGSDAIQITNKQGSYADTSPCWSPDGKKIAFVRRQLNKGGYSNIGIYVMDSSGGEPELLVSESGKWVNSLIWSTNGKMLAWFSQEKEDPTHKARLLNVYDFSTGESRIAGEVASQHVNIEAAWSPDSKRIAYNDKEGKVIKIMNLENGSIEDIETGLVDVTIHHLDWSPDGERFVFGGFKGGNKEFWFVENFLPLTK